MCQCQCLDAVWRARFGRRRWTKRKLHLQIGIYKSLYLRPCWSCRESQKVPTMLLCPARNPANVPIVCSGKKLWPFDPTCALADLPVEFWRLDSKPTSHVPSDVPAGVPHSKTSPNAAYIRFLTRVLSQLQTRDFQPEYSNCEEYRAIPMTNLHQKVVPRWHGILSEMKHQVSKGDLFFTLWQAHPQSLPANSCTNRYEFTIKCSQNVQTTATRFPLNVDAQGSPTISKSTFDFYVLAAGVSQNGLSQGDLCIWCGGHWRNTPLKTQHCQSISASQAPKFSDFPISNGCCGNILCLAVCGKEDQHPASYSQQLSTCILTIFVLDCDRVPWPQRHPLSQVLVAVVLGWLRLPIFSI